MSELPRLLGVLAHEMRTPLAAILGYQELLYEGVYGKVDERGREPLERIAYAARQLLHLIDGVQEITTPSTPLAFKYEPFEPAAALRQCVGRLADEVQTRNVKLNVAVPERLDEFDGDVDRFCRSVELALGAAIKASPRTTLDLSARSDGGQLIITIALTRLSLQRDDPALVDRPAGTDISGAALRLAIARHIARRMRGDLTLHASEAGTSVVLAFS